MPLAKRIPEDEWARRKNSIHHMYLVQNLTSLNIVQELARSGFHVTKSQLDRKLKSWGLHKNVIKGQGEPAWVYIAHEMKKRKLMGKDTNVFINNEIQNRAKVDKAIGGYYGIRLPHELSPIPPENVDVLLRTPPSLPLVPPWPSALPWLQFREQYAKQFSLTFVNMSEKNRFVEDFTSRFSDTVLRITNAHDTPSRSISGRDFESRISVIMPDSIQEEPVTRLSINTRDQNERILQEQLMIFICSISNKLMSDWDEWEFLLEILECSGILSTPMSIDKSATTLLALREGLLQLCLRVLVYPSRFIKCNYSAMRLRTLKIIEWILSSGQTINTFLWGKYTPLHVAIHTRSPEMVDMLLNHGANPNFIIYPSEMRHHWMPDLEWTMPPLLLAAYRARDREDIKVIDKLLQFNASIASNRRIRKGFLSYETFSTIAAGHKRESVALDLMEMIFSRYLNTPDNFAKRLQELNFIAADVTIAAASRGNCEVLQLLYNRNINLTGRNEFGLTALHAAAFSGHLECCKQLIHLGFDADLYDSDIPSPIHLACYQNHFEVVKFLHERGAQIGRTFKITRGSCRSVANRFFCGLQVDAENFDAVVELQSPIGAVFARKQERESGRVTVPLYPPFTTPHTFSAEFSPLLVRYLLEHGAELPEFAAIRSASCGETEILSIALQNGTKPNATGTNPFTCTTQSLLQAALYARSVETVKLLLKEGAEVTYRKAVQIIGLNNQDLTMETLRHDFDHAPKGEATLVEAAFQADNLPLVQELLRRKSEGYTPAVLCAAVHKVCVYEWDKDIISTLLAKRDADFLSTKSLELESTAIGIAANCENWEVLELLLDSLPVGTTARLPGSLDWVFFYGGDEPVEPVCYDMEFDFWRGSDVVGSVLTYAIEGDISIVDRLLECGYRFDWFSICRMVHSGDCQKFLGILHSQQILPHKEADLHLAIAISVYQQDLDLCKALIKIFGNNIQKRRKTIRYGNPLVTAIEVGNSEIFNVLLEAGFDPQVPPLDDEDMTALQAAAIYGRMSMAKRLLDEGVDINAEGSWPDGRTALQGAAEHGHIDMIKLLLSYNVGTTGLYRLQFIRAIVLAENEGHQAAAGMLRTCRNWTDEDDAMMRDENLQRKNSSTSIEDGQFDSQNYNDRGNQYNDTIQSETSDVGSQNGDNGDSGDHDGRENGDQDIGLGGDNCYELQTMVDPTLMECDDEFVLGAEFSGFRLELGLNLADSTPSAGIYDLESPLFGIDDGIW